MGKIAVSGVLICSSIVLWAADYVADGWDPGRTGWIKDERIFNKTNVRNMRLLWKVKLDSNTRQMHNLMVPTVIEKVATPAGTREIAVLSGVSDDLWAFDTATGAQLWHKHFDPPSPESIAGRNPSTLCPGGQLANPAVAPGNGPGKYTLYSVSWDGRVHQVNVSDGEELYSPVKFLPPNGKPWSLNLVNGVIYTSTSQGCGGVPNAFYSFDIATQRASAFQPGGGGMWGRRGVAAASDGKVYMGTGDGYYNPDTKNLGDAIAAVKQNPQTKQLELAGYFAPPNTAWLWHRDLDVNVSPVVIDYKGKHLLFGTSKECRIWMVDRDVMNDLTPGPHHQQMLDRTPLICNPAARYDAAGVWGAMAAWIDPTNQLYLAVPFLGPMADSFHAPIEIGKPELGGVAVLRIEENAGKWRFAPVWTYGDIDQGDEAIYANGVLFVDGAGEDTYQSQPDSAFDEAPRKPFVGANNQTGNRLGNSRKAALYAFDAENGKLLWSSGNQIESFNHGSGFTAVNGKAYIGTFDGTLYCFSVPN